MEDASACKVLPEREEMGSRWRENVEELNLVNYDNVEYGNYLLMLLKIRSTERNFTMCKNAKWQIKKELYKTKICERWKRYQFCRYGTRCCFAHGSHELRLKPNPHPKYKTEMCKKFRAGYCPYGSRCCFIHSPVNKICF